MLLQLCGQGLQLEWNGFGGIQVMLCVLLWGISTIYSLEYFSGEGNKRRFYIAWGVTFVSTVGLFLSADLFTAFVCFEVMSLTSYLFVIDSGKEEAITAGTTYLFLGILGGMAMLMGIFLVQYQAGTLVYKELIAACELVEKKYLYAAAGLLLFGFGAKAGMYPLHFWSPKVYVEAPAPASAILSGMLSKAGIFGMLMIAVYLLPGNLIWGNLILTLGIITMVWGAIIALFAVNMKKIFAGSSMSQIGFIMVGVGMISLLGEHNTLAVWGVILHMVNHSIFKLIFFTLSGIVEKEVDSLQLDEIVGFGKGKPVFLFSYLMAGFGITGFPFWSGYISKTLLHESIVEYIVMLSGQSSIFYRVAEYLFLFAGGLTIAYIVKLFVVLFVKDVIRGEEKIQDRGSYSTMRMKVILVCCTTMIPIMGTLPHHTMEAIGIYGQGFLGAHLPEHMVHYFAFVNLKGAVISVCIGVIVYALVVNKWLTIKDGRVCDRWPRWFDIEYLLYRPLLLKVLPTIFGGLCIAIDKIPDTCVMIGRKTVLRDTKVRLLKIRQVAEKSRTDLSVSFALYGIGFSCVLLYLLIRLVS